MKWFALALILFGLVAIRRAFTRPLTFEEGSFIKAFLLGWGGLSAVIAGLAWLLVLGFLAI